MRFRFISGRHLVMTLVVLIGIALGVAIQTATYQRELPEFTDIQETLEEPVTEPEFMEPEDTETLSGQDEVEEAAARSFPLPKGAQKQEANDWSSQDILLEYTLAREQSRSSQLELLKEVASDPDSSPVVRQEAQSRILEIARLKELEVNLAGLLQSQGYSSPVVVASEYGVTISLGKSLTQSEAQTIGGLVAKLSGFPEEKIVILERQDP